MAEVSLKHIEKIYPNIEGEKKHFFGKKKDAPKKKSNLKQVDGGVLAVEDFNLDIADREFIVLVGPSGCGKSTTLRMVAGLEEITSGELYIDGKLMNDVAPKDRDIAMVFQSYALYPHMTVRENMAFPLKLRNVPKDQVDKKVEEAASILGITEYLDRKPKALSGGQRQRVAIARALVNNPQVIVADEPTGNLDPQRSLEIMMLLEKINELGTTVLVVTHEKELVNRFSKRVVAIENGRIISDGMGGYYNNESV